MKIIAIIAALALPSAAFAQVEGKADAAAQNTTQVSNYAITGAGDGSLEYKGLYGVLGGTTSVMPGASNSQAPCALVKSDGIAIGPFGKTKTRASEAPNCLLERAAGILEALGRSPSPMREASLALMCQSMSVADAIWAAFGKACRGTQASGRYVNADGSAPEVFSLAEITPPAAPAK